MLAVTSELARGASGNNAASILGPLLGIVVMVLVILAARAWRKRISKD